jgi:peptidoglycan/xylan/chitin deacetylase (PgdA/CDA1 family)
MKLTKVPNWVRKYKSNRVWDFLDSKETLYLTFDDGPDPEVTKWVIDYLNQEDIKATFFCVGANVEKHTETYRELLQNGHSVGNHTYHHKNAWKTTKEDYINDIEKASEYIESRLFRPPYGKINNQLVNNIQEMGFEVVMWSVLSYDFQKDLDCEKQLTKLKKVLKPGDIIVFHDSQKAFENLKILLPSIVEFIKSNNWKFDKIE